MLLFGCTSVFQLMVIIYIMEKEYRNDIREKKLFILDHVTNLVSMYDRLIESRFWNDIIIIHSDKVELTDIRRQIDEIELNEGDVFHLFGLEYVSFYMTSILPKNVKCIFTDEGIMSKVNLKACIEKHYNPAWFDGKKFDFDWIDELWLLDERLSMNDLQIPIKNLSMAENLKDIEIREQYLKKLEVLFPDAVNNKLVSDVVFFDSYYLGIYEMISPELEMFLLQKLCETLGDYKLVIKPHPGEMNYEKYHQISSKVLKESYIPWEVFRLLENPEQEAKKRILITYSIGGAIMSEKWLLNDKNTYFIFINTIYDKYSRKPVFVFDLLPKFIEAYGNDRMYYPKTFIELKNIIDMIMEKNTGNENSLTSNYQSEQKYLLDWFVDAYKKNWVNQPPYYNYSTLLAQNDNNWYTLDEVRCVGNESGKFSFTFSNKQKEQANMSYRWYAIRSQKAKIRISKIVYMSYQATEEINLELLKNVPCKDNEGYFIFNNFDPVIEFDIHKDFDSIMIEGDWIFDNSFAGIIETFNKSSKEYEKQLADRDRIIELLNHDLQNRDEVIHNALNDLANRDSVIVSLNHDIQNRDLVIKNALNDLGNRDEVIQTALKDIAERDKIISEIRLDGKKKFFNFKK